MIARLEKCLFGHLQLPFLGHLVGSEGISSLPEKMSAIKDFSWPISVRDLQRFSGLLKYYQRIIPGTSIIFHPLHLACSNQPPSSCVSWDSYLTSAFETAKSALLDAAC